MFAITLVLLALATLLLLGLADRAKRYAAEEQAERETHGREVLGTLEVDAAVRDERVRRANFRHVTRFTEKSGPRRANDRAA